MLTARESALVASIPPKDDFTDLMAGHPLSPAWTHDQELHVRPRCQLTEPDLLLVIRPLHRLNTETR